LLQSKQRQAMKTQYRFLFFVCLLAGRMAVGQELGPGGPAGVDAPAPASGNALRIGAGVAIPLYKLFGPKKAKTLPVWDKYRTLGLPDSLVGKGLITDVPLGTDPDIKPIQAVMSGGVSGTGGTGVGEGSRTNDIDLPEVTVRPAPAYTIDLPPVTVTAPAPQPTGGGGYPGFGTPPSPDGPATIPLNPEDDRPKPRFTDKETCKTLQDMWSQTLDVDGNPSIEVFALFTSAGTLVLPTSGRDCYGDYHTNTVSGSYTNYLGHFVTTQDSSGELYQFYELCDGTRVQVYAAVHTHPSTAIGNPFQPSPGDRTFAATHPGMDHFILGKDGVAKFQPDGNCEEPASSNCN
jgi:hypothetical protein